MPWLEWLDRQLDTNEAGNVKYRLLEPVASHSHGDPDDPNMLIQGDNLDALKSLLPYFGGEVKCVFIDPPYNTQSAFKEYDDNLEHAKWLSMMYPRLELLRKLLHQNGSLWITIDDSEGHYLKVICDEIFGRKNFVANVIWQKKSSPQSNATWLSDSHDHILVYAKDKESWRPNKLPRSDAQNAIYKHSDEHDGIDENGKWYGRGPWFPGDFTLSLASGQRGKQFALTGTDPNLYKITTPSGRVVEAAKGRAWAYTEPSYQRLRADNRVHFGKKGDSKPTIKRFLGEIQEDGVVPMTVWHYKDVGENRNAAAEVKVFNPDDPFATPKPEKLIQRILEIASQPGDLVLDSFLGSGTTAAVAHKMGRRWIGIEEGEHAKTQCEVRIKSVLDGEQGGISKAVGWSGGGGFRFFKLGPTVFDENDQIRQDIPYAHLAAHVWFIETGEPRRTRAKDETPLLGVHEGTAYYLLYNGILGDRRVDGGNVLTLKLLSELPAHDGPKVIYGEATRLSEERLASLGVVFKQIPYELKAA